MAHLVDGVRQVVVVFEEIEGAKAQKLKGDTHVTMVVKPVKHLDTEAEKRDGGRGTSDELPSAHQPPPRRGCTAVKSTRLHTDTPARATTKVSSATERPSWYTQGETYYLPGFGPFSCKILYS